MAYDTRDLKVRITGDTSGLSKSLATTESSLSDAGASVVKFAKFTAVALTGVATAAIGLGTSAIKGSGEFEQSRVAFETMLGSAEKARAIMGDIADFAKSTPFELPDVVSGTKQLLAFGFAQEELIPTMRKLGDLAAGLGVPVGQLVFTYGQVRTAGKLMGQDLNQFINAGVPLIEALATTMKKPQSEIKKLVEEGKIGFPEVEKAMNSLTGSGSKFGGMMDKQSKTFDGVVSNIKDGFGQLLRGAVGMSNTGDIVKGGFFDKIKEGAQMVMEAIGKIDVVAVGKQLTDMTMYFVGVSRAVLEVGTKVADYLMPKLMSLWSSIQTNLAPILSDLWHNIIQPLIPLLGESLVFAIGLVVDVISHLIDGLGWVYKQLQEGNPIIWTLVGAFGGLAAAMAFNTVFTALSAGFAVLTTVTLPAVMASVASLSAFIAMPMVMPAVIIGAALLSLGTVINKANDTSDAIRGASGALDTLNQTLTQTRAAMDKAYSEGRISSEKYKAFVEQNNKDVADNAARRKEQLYTGFFGPLQQSFANLGEWIRSGDINAKAPSHFATGGIVGGVAAQGDNTLIAATPGEMVLNKEQQQNLFRALNGGSVSGSNVTLHVNIGMYAGMPVEKREIALELYKELVRAARAQGVSLPMIGAVGVQ